jgi:hypothetical protein
MFGLARMSHSPCKWFVRLPQKTAFFHLISPKFFKNETSALYVYSCKIDTMTKDEKNPKPLDRIIEVLKNKRDGLWIREIARQANMNAMSVSYHISKHPHLFEERSVEGPNKILFRLVKLHKNALSRPSIMLNRILSEIE